MTRRTKTRLLNRHRLIDWLTLGIRRLRTDDLRGLTVIVKAFIRSYNQKGKLP